MGRGTKGSNSWRLVRFVASLLAATLLLCSCVPAAIQSGVYVASLSSDDSAQWIGAPAAAPVWSPDGGSIAWATEQGILIGKPDGQTPRQLTTSPVAGKPSWSPDGTMIAFVDGDAAALTVVDAFTGGPKLESPIRNVGAASEPTALVSIGGPSWSPDGGKLAFICWDGRGDEVCVIDVDGSERRQVTHIGPVQRGLTASPAGSNVGPPVWSPNGEQLAVPAFAETRGSASGIFVVLVEPGIARRVTALQPTSDVVWTADGRALIFAATVDSRSDVYRVSAAGGLARNLTQSLPDGGRDPALSPDGSQLAVASGRDIQILGTETKKIGSSDESMRDRFPAWNPRGDEVAFSSSPALVTKFD